MKNLIKAVEKLEKSEVKNLVDARMKEFKELGKKSNKEIFNELCFCMLTANFNAEKSIKMQDGIGNGFLTLSQLQLSEKLKEFGHRFPNARAQYIVEARKHKDSLRKTIESFGAGNELRDWLVENIKGIGYKEASHFLRNIGFTNLAIIDFHIIDILAKHKLIERSKTLTKKKYLEIEGVLKDIAQKTNLNLAELDLYLWYLETGKVLK